MRMGVWVGGGLHLQVIETGKSAKNNNSGYENTADSAEAGILGFAFHL